MASIYDLPDEILEYILNFVSPYDDLHSCLSVSKQWRKYVKNVVRIRKRNLNKSIANFNVKWNTYEPSEGNRCIGRRYSHAATFFENSMYIFGGCTCSMTTFNDLWKYDLSKREWIRPLATGTYPSPKACSSLANYNDKLVLFGGWTYPPSYPLYQSCHLFNELHVYDIQNNHWNSVETSIKPPPMAGHSISIVDNNMIVFGGLIKNEDTVECEKSNDVWKLNLDNWTWTKQEVDGQKKPECRFGQTQVVLNNENILILGGSGGTHVDFWDAWVLNMSNKDEWKWIPVEIKGKANKPKNIWSNPGCKVDDKMVVLNRLQTDTIFPLNSSRSHPEYNREGASASPSNNKQPDLDENVNGKWGTLRFPNSNDLPIPLLNRAPARVGVEQEMYGEVLDDLAPQRVFPNDKMFRAELNRRKIYYKQRQTEAKRKQNRSKHCLGLYVLDLEHATEDKPYVTWLTPKNFNKGPQETILYTLIEGNSELIMFGGIESDGANIGALNNPITNSIHVMSCNIDVI